MAKYNGVVLVAGASGGVGWRAVRALRREGIETRAIVRNPDKAEQLKKMGASIVVADVTDPASMPALKQAMEGVTAVISALGTRQPFSPKSSLKAVDYYGNGRLVNAARATGVKRFILNSTMGVHQERSILRPFSILFYPKWEAEAYLVKSGLTYTIIRPGGLVDKESELNGPAGWTHRPALALTSLRGDGGYSSLMGGRVLRDDVAEAMVRSLWTPATENRIFDILDYATVKPAERAKVLTDLFKEPDPAELSA